MIDIRPWPKDATAHQMQALEDLFAALHAHMAGRGMSDALVPDGAKAWSGSMMPMLGRMTFIHGAWEGERLVGFVAGMLRSLPPYLGGARTGALTHIHVQQDARGTGTGARLFQALADTFRASGAVRMEVDVLAGNTDAQIFFDRMGCKTHHLILHRPL